MSYPLVALIGRPNVGKSSLFNRFLRKRIAIVDDTPGVTRDRNYALCDWNGRYFYLIDTGGIIPDSRLEMARLILDQSETAISQADLILFVVDCQTGPDDIDQKIASNIRKSDKKVILLANKADNETEAMGQYEFLKLGLGDPIAVSATAGENIGDALDVIVEKLPSPEELEVETPALRIAVIGRPNAGKSMFINRLIGQERVIVSPVPGTTRDAVDTPFEFEGRQYVLIDTAGLRRKARVKEDIEYYTTLRTLRAIENCDIALILIDAEQGLAFQDMKIVDDAIAARRGIVLAVNKWDLIEKDQHTADRFTEEIKNYARTLNFIPIIYISALTGQRVEKTLKIIDQVNENWQRRIPTSQLNDFLENIVAKQPPAAVQGKYIRIKYITQVDIKPPTFVIFCNFPKLIQKAYLRYIENRLRDEYEFEGIPLRIKVRQK